MAKNLPATKPKTDVVNWTSMLKESAAKQAKASESLAVSSVMVSFKGAILSIGGIQRRNNTARVVVLCIMNERAFYSGKYNPDEPRTPVCYAYGEVDGGLPEEPHEASTDKQSDACKGCPNAEWGTADVGRGQACRQSVKLALVALPEGKPSAIDIDRLDINFARIPPTSLKAVKVYLDWLGANGMATFSTITKLEVVPSSKSIFTVHLTPEEELPGAWHGAIAAKVKAAQTAIDQPYPEFEERQPQQRQQPTGKKRY